VASSGGSPETPTVVFLGPTLSRAAAERLFRADYQPPAAKGDFYRYLGTRTQAIVLIDGLFHAQPSVWQREILAALAEGISVVGASSMGALRAAELHLFGMAGHGTVFQWYRDGVIDGDDEVALLHGAEDSDYRPLSEPLVNIRYNLQRAVQARLLLPDEEQATIEVLKKRYYGERSAQLLADAVNRLALPPSRAERLQRFLREEAVDLKRQDAVSLLEMCAASGAGTNPSAPHPLGGAKAFERLQRLEREEIDYRIFTVQGRAVPGKVVLQRAQARKDPVVHRQLLVRWFLTEWARLKAERCPASDEEAFVARWIEQHVGAPGDDWLARASLTRTEFRKSLSDLALVDWLRRTGAARFGVTEQAVEEAYLADWAALNGVQLLEGVQGMLARGPRALGFEWAPEVCLIRELQLTGRLDELGS
jgi:hypothetical protein